MPPKSLVALLVSLSFSLGLCLPAGAIDPGRIQGSLRVNGQDLVLGQAYAHLHDNAEKVLDFPQELRLLLTDREVSQDSLAGISTGKVEELARQDRLRGLLLKLDPGNPKRFELILLLPPASPDSKLWTWTITATDPPPPLILNMSPQRLGGSLTLPPLQLGAAGQPDLTGSLRFSAPVFHEPPVTAVLVGRAAFDSPQNRALQAQIHPRRGGGAPPGDAGLSPSRRQLQRVVVRGHQATVIFPGRQWHNLVKAGEVWRLEE